MRSGRLPGPERAGRLAPAGDERLAVSPPGSEEVRQGHPNSLLFVPFLSSFRVAADLLLALAAPRVPFQPGVPALSLRPGASEALAARNSVAEASGASGATSLPGRWGRGAGKLRELRPERGRRSRCPLAHRQPQVSVSGGLALPLLASFPQETPLKLWGAERLDLDGAGVRT